MQWRTDSVVQTLPCKTDVCLAGQEISSFSGTNIALLLSEQLAAALSRESTGSSSHFRRLFATVGLHLNIIARYTLVFPERSNCFQYFSKSM
jgi:hypothetical protein